MLGSFQILDDGQPRRRPDGGSLYWRGVFPRAEAEIVPGSWDVAGLRGTGSFDWTVEDVFLPERRTMPQVGIPLDNQWERWPGITYALPSPVLGRAAPQRGDHRHRARRDRRADRAGGREDAARPDRHAVREPAGPGRHRAGRRDPERRARLPQREIAELWATVAAGKDTTLEQRARCRLASIYAGDSAREAMDLVYRHGGSTSFKRESRLAECWRDLHVVGQTVTIAPEWYPIGGRVYLGMDPGPASALAHRHGWSGRLTRRPASAERNSRRPGTIGNLAGNFLNSASKPPIFAKIHALNQWVEKKFP